MHAEDKARYEKELQENPEAQRRLEKAKKRAAVAKAGKTKITASINSSAQQNYVFRPNV